MLRRLLLIAALAALAVCLGAAPALAAPLVSGEFAVPGLGSNNKLVQGPDNNMWVTTGGGGGKEVAKVTPDGQVTEYDIEAVTPLGITAANGLIWVARNGGVVSFDPADPEGTNTVFDVAKIGTDPSVVLGPDGNLWVASTDKLTKVPPGNPAGATEIPVTGLKTPKDIDVAGSLIVVAASEHIFAVDLAGNVVGDHKVGGQAQGVGGNPNGQYAFTQPVTPPKEIGLLAPGAAPLVRSAEGTDPFGITLGVDGAYWSPEFISDGLTRISTDGTVSGITGFAENSGPRQIAAGPGNTLWVTLEMTKKVGRVSGLEPPAQPQPQPPTPIITVPQTRIKSGPKGRLTTRKNFRPVNFGFESPDLATAFECRLVKLAPRGKAKGNGAKGAAKAKAKPPQFKRCASPKGYKAKPGRYRFEVRAVNTAGADPTPAKRSFRVVRVG